MGRARTGTDRRAEILRAAGELFQRRGFHQVSMNEVAAAVEITAPALYRHVRGKQELLRQTVTAVLDGFEAALAPALAPARAGGRPSLDSLAEALATATLDNRTLGALLHREVRYLEPERRAEAEDRLRRIAEEIAAALDAAGAPGEPRLRAWAALFAYGSVSLHGASLPRARFERQLAGLGRALFTVPLGAATDRPRPQPAESGGPAPSRREELLRAAVRLFHQRGFEAVSVNELGAAVGIAGPSVYKHFGGKAEILAAASARTRERVRLAMEGALAAPGGSGTPGETLERMLDAYIDYAVGNPDNLGLVPTGTVHLPEPDLRESLAFRREFVGGWAGLLGESRPGLEPTAARITVQAAVTLINDAVSLAPLRDRPDLGPRLRELGRAVLQITPAHRAPAAGRTSLDSGDKDG
ncbi:TetR/AcrR family transcriptional regulator [Phaeacidiphilus oryzae]|uniref:TetR/AcrR family transcriptional regulator n=1 Tax=Phaeacidiphilus oryzae TaxID=348818 RepID=UPI0006925D37|nr:TetR/AcrR family transcriptional regulator [Phaeacidiphilus oryzae]